MNFKVANAEVKRDNSKVQDIYPDYEENEKADVNVENVGGCVKDNVQKIFRSFFYRTFNIFVLEHDVISKDIIIEPPGILGAEGSSTERRNRN